jgi:O-6-methylguanine DNA methyltransferase
MSWQALRLKGLPELYLVANGEALTEIRFWPGEDLPARQRSSQDVILRQAATELEQYWAGERRVFSVPYESEGTEFQCRVWEAVAAIPFGEIRSYAEIASAVGRPKAVRAVGAANGANRLPIVIPCHRVLTSGGELGGYGGGLNVKRALLSREGIEL